MANTIKEQARLALLPEITWGTAPTGNMMLLEADAGEWLHEIVEEWRDEMVRNTLARDFGSVPTVARAEGSIGGAFYPIMPGFFLQSMFGGTEIKSNLRNTASGDTTLDVHEFVIGPTQTPLSIQQEDDIDTEMYLGMLVNNLTIRFTTGEGAVEWEADLIGQGRIWEAARTVVENSLIVATPQTPFIGSMASVNINGNTQARILDFEIVFSREIELAYGAANTRRPNIRRAGPPRITFRATAELQLSTDVQKYAFDAGASQTFDEANATYFDSNLDTWHVRIATDPDINTASTPLPITAAAGGNHDGTIGDEFGLTPDTNQGVLDIFLDRVTYASTPIIIDRSQNTATLEFNGVALYDQADSRLGIFRLMNAKGTTYLTADLV